MSCTAKQSEQDSKTLMPLIAALETCKYRPKLFCNTLHKFSVQEFTLDGIRKFYTLTFLAAKYKNGMKKMRFLTYISLYLGNDTRWP